MQSCEADKGEKAGINFRCFQPSLCPPLDEEGFFMRKNRNNKEKWGRTK